MEKRMNSFKKWFALGAFSLLVLGLPAIASAQWRDRDRDDDNGRRGGYGRNGGYNNNLNGVIRNLENRARRFEDQLDHADSNNGNRGRGNNRIDNLEELSDRFVNAAKRLDNEYDDRGDFRSSRDEAQRVLEIGSQIANAYGLRYNERHNGRNGGGGRRNNPYPF